MGRMPWHSQKFCDHRFHITMAGRASTSSRAKTQALLKMNQFSYHMSLIFRHKDCDTSSSLHETQHTKLFRKFIQLYVCPYLVLVQSLIQNFLQPLHKRLNFHLAPKWLQLTCNLSSEPKILPFLQRYVFQLFSLPQKIFQKF